MNEDFWIACVLILMLFTCAVVVILVVAHAL